MEIEAVKQAEERLRRAERAFVDLKTSKNHLDAASAWSSFLLAANSVYSKLEKGAKGTKSEPWFGTKKHERRKDDLLSYAHQARNSDEHGLIKIVDEHEGFAVTRIEYPNGVVPPTHTTWIGPNGEKFVTPGPGAKTRVTRVLGRIELVPVYCDRSKKWFPVPTRHLGNDISDQSPMNIASLMLGYLRTLVAESFRKTV